MRDHFESLGKIVRNSKRKPPFRRAALGHLPEILLYKFIRIAFEPLLSLLICEWKNINFVIPARRRILSPQKESTVAGSVECRTLCGVGPMFDHFNEFRRLRVISRAVNYSSHKLSPWCQIR